MHISAGSQALDEASRREQTRQRAAVLFPAAVDAYREGRHQDAQTICRDVLKDLPDHFDALHLLGVSEADCGRFEQASATLARATALHPNSAEAQSNLGWSLLRQGRCEDARICLERAVALHPDFPTALTNLGTALMHLQRHDEAIAAHDRAIALKPGYTDAHYNRGMALLLADRYEEAKASFEQALALDPRHLPALRGNSLAALNLQNFEEALAAVNAALAIRPDIPILIVQRGRIYQQLCQFERAEADFDAALSLEPDLEPALCGKANVSALTGRTAHAMAACCKVLARNPNSESALTLLGSCLTFQGEIEAALFHFDRALTIRPDNEDALTKKIFALDFVPDADFVALQAARRQWWDAIGSRLPRRQLRGRRRDPERRLVVGYVSSDFRNHSAALAFMPILRHHDREQFRTVAYSCSPERDDATERCRATVDDWVEAWQLSDERLADRIEADQVDILVDLSGHSAGHRLKLFARKPAPIQVTAVGAVSGTGLPVMDYLLADPVVIPHAVRHLFAERVHDLPSLITIEPPPEIPPSPPPMLRNGYVSFGVFNRTYKISREALTLWSKLMAALPGSIIVVKNGSMSDSLLREELRARFVAHGIAEDRIRCIGTTSRIEHLAMFAEIDISLDPLPQNGGISTWESLQMGVPVVSKLGTGAGSRCGGAIIKAIGLHDWVADDEDGYLSIALNHASRPQELAALRASLPARVAASPAGNCEIYTRRVEAAYRTFWRDYCAASAA